jgi:hypothetical protein
MNVSRRRKLAQRAGLALAALFLLVQFVQPDRSNPPVVSEVHAPPQVAAILERSCYDCHSNRTEWPWYAYVAPVSWWVADHVEEGRGDLNFSDWPVVDFEAVDDSLRDIEKQVAKGEMPLPQYLWLHPEARLSDEDKEALLDWARSGL